VQVSSAAEVSVATAATGKSDVVAFAAAGSLSVVVRPADEAGQNQCSEQ